MTQTPDLVDVAVHEGYETWTMNAPPVNAIGPDMLSALERALAAAEAREEVSVVLLTSGQKVFSAGADATWMNDLYAEGIDHLVDTFVHTMDRFRELSISLRRSPLLIVAVLNGHTLAGGLELAAACDLRFCADADRLKIGVPEMDLFGAMPSGGGGVQFISRLMGPSRALDFILDASPVDPRRAEQLGLVDRLYATDELAAAADTYAAAAAAKAGRIGVSALKRAVLAGADLGVLEALELDRSLHWDAIRRGNFARGVAAFTEQFASQNRG